MIYLLLTVLCSVAFNQCLRFGQRPGTNMISVVLMRRLESTHRRFSLKGDLALFACFAMAGTIITIHKSTEVHFTADQREVYKTILFIVASLSSLSYAIARRVQFHVRDIVSGAMIGILNATMLLTVLRGLALIPAVVFFPTVASIEISLNVTVSRILWKERLLRRQWIGLLLAMGSYC